MSRFFFLLICFIVVREMPGYAQAPEWQWAISADETFDAKAWDIVTDVNGNALVIGYSASSTTFGTTTLPYFGNNDMFIVKLDNSGNVLWAKSAGGNSSDKGTGIATDDYGNVYATGYFYSPTIAFDTIVLTKADTYDIFIAKYDSSGNVLWAKSAGGTGDDRGIDISTDKSGNILLTGTFTSPSLNFDTIVLTNKDSNDFFIVKYDSAGKVLWAKSGGGNDNDFSMGIATDGNGNVFTTGYFNSPSISFDTTTLTNAGTYDFFILKLDSSGNLVWAKTTGGTGWDISYGITADTSGNIFVVGRYSGFISFGTHNSLSSYRGFIAKYDSSGNDLWVNYAGQNNSIIIIGVSTDMSGDAFVTGFFYGSMLRFASSTITLTNSETSGSWPDIFTTKYDTAGTLQWAKSAGGEGAIGEYAMSLASSQNGKDIFTTGYFYCSSMAFDSINLTNNNTSTANLFIAKLSDNLTGITEEINEEKEIKIYPNPFSNQFAIFLPSDQAAAITIYNIFGQPVYRASFKGQQSTIDFSSFPKGIYFLRANINNQLQTVRIIKL